MTTSRFVLAATVGASLLASTAASLESHAEEQVSSVTVEQTRDALPDTFQTLVTDADVETGLELASGNDGLELTTQPHWIKSDSTSTESEK